MGDETIGSWDEVKIVCMVDNAITQGGALIRHTIPLQYCVSNAITQGGALDTQYCNGNTLLHMCAYIGNAGM